MLVTVTSNVALRPLCHGIKVSPSGRFQSSLVEPCGSLIERTSALDCARHKIFQMMMPLRPARVLLAREGMHEDSAGRPQEQRWVWHMTVPRRNSTAMRTASPDRRRSHAVIVITCSQIAAIRGCSRQYSGSVIMFCVSSRLLNVWLETIESKDLCSISR